MKKKKPEPPKVEIPTHCQYSKCGKPIEQRGRNPKVPRRYCNARCRVFAWQERNPRVYEKDKS